MPTVVKKIRSFLYSSKLVWSLFSLSFNPLLDFHFHFCFFQIASVLTVFSLCRQRVPSNVFIFLIHFFRCSFPSILSPGAFPSATVSVQFKLVILTIVHSRNMLWVYYPLFWHQYAWGHARTWRLSFLSYLHVLAFWVIVIVGNAGLHCHKLCPLLYVWRQ